ncbi:MAG: oligosaccharide flippase family protein, partial [Butyrivibrio sp.]|nr:oligosaccharide flippase family protein [Butyrivibrio sp.]
MRNSSWLVADKIIRLFGGLLVGALVARYLGPEQYGLMNFVSAFAAIFISFSMLGIDNLVIRELSRKNAEINKILGTAVKIRNCGSVISSILSLIFAYFLYYDNNSLFLLLLAIFMVGNILQSLDVISLWYQSRIESK